jgi:hypothetical protein
MYIKGYQYQTEQEAINARKQCADYYGLPKSPEDITQYWVDYQTADDFFYIIFDESLLPILGEPIEFEINEND